MIPGKLAASDGSLTWAGFEHFNYNTEMTDFMQYILELWNRVQPHSGMAVNLVSSSLNII